MKNIFILFLNLIAIIPVWSQAPDWAWAASGKGGGDDESKKMAADASGNVFITGYYAGNTIAFGSNTLTNSSTSGTREFFIAKYSRSGSVLWAVSGSGTDDDEGLALCVDGSGNVFVAGTFESATMNIGSSVLTNSSSSGLSDIFLAKFSSAGVLQWARSYGSNQQELPAGLACDASGNVYMTGSFYSLSVLFGSYGVINSGQADAFITKIDGSGTAQWAKKIGAGFTDTGSDVTVDASGNIFVCGDFNSTSISTFSPALANAGGFDIFYAKYDAAGNNLLSGRFGGSGDESAKALSSAGSSAIAIAGYFESASLNLGSVTLTNSSSRNMFIAGLSLGAVVQWGNRAEGNALSYPSDLTSDASGDVYMTGSFNLATVNFGGNTLNNGGGTDAFIVKYAASGGAVIWAKASGSAGQELSNTIAVDNNGKVLISGLFTSTLTLGANVLVSLSSTDVFTVKLCNAPAGPVSVSGATVCPKVSGMMTVVTPPGTTASWYPVLTGGSPLATATSSFSTKVPGTYYVSTTDTSNGCGVNSASRIAVTLANITGPNPSVSISGNTLSAMGQGSLYTWYNCATAATLSGQTSQNYVITTSGVFAVIMSYNGCKDTSACLSYSYNPGTGTVIVSGVSAVSGNEDIVVYPNPASDYLFVPNPMKQRFVVFGFDGKQIGETDSNDPVHIDLSSFPEGIYFLRPSSGTRIVRFIVLRKD